MTRNGSKKIVEDKHFTICEKVDSAFMNLALRKKKREKEYLQCGEGGDFQEVQNYRGFQFPPKNEGSVGMQRNWGDYLSFALEQERKSQVPKTGKPPSQSPAKGLLRHFIIGKGGRNFQHHMRGKARTLVSLRGGENISAGKQMPHSTKECA